MKWIMLGDYHLNVEEIRAFWYDSRNSSLNIGIGCPGYIYIQDPDKLLYKKLCTNTGETPVFGWEPLEKYGE